MSNINDVWSFEKKLPKWTAEVVSGLKRLDAADAAPGKQPLDGKYLGVDLKSFAQLYAARSNSKSVPTFTRLVDATEALRSYSKHPSADALGRAMFEGAQAMLEGRAPKYAAVEGFNTRFIDVDFALMVNDISQGKMLPGVKTWKDYWQMWLGGCWPDLFVRQNPCDHCACEFPR